jgi:hypothetical protein
VFYDGSTVKLAAMKLFAYLVTDYTTYRCTAYGSQGTAISKHRTSDAAKAGTDSSVSLLFSHSGASRKHENGRQDSRLNNKTADIFHDLTSIELGLTH